MKAETWLLQQEKRSQVWDSYVVAEQPDILGSFPAVSRPPHMMPQTHSDYLKSSSKGLAHGFQPRPVARICGYLQLIVGGLRPCLPLYSLQKFDTFFGGRICYIFYFYFLNFLFIFIFKFILNARFFNPCFN